MTGPEPLRSDDEPEVDAPPSVLDAIEEPQADLFGRADVDESRVVSLHDKYVVPPFSTLDGRAGGWHERKRAWMSLGIQSELGRGEGLAFNWEMGDTPSTSVFDPVLTELMYRWFSPPGGHVLDPFAGGSVRGIVASVMGRSYWGIDLREEQVEANRQQALQICRPPMPAWFHDDARNVVDVCDGQQLADFVFTCPPYFDLEVYSDDPRDLSNMGSYEDFVSDFDVIVRRAAACLKPDRFAAIVVGPARGRDGNYYGIIADTIDAFRKAGMGLYNQAVYVHAVGTAAMRVSAQFENSRKMARVHQDVLVFVKGDGVAATRACGSLDNRAGQF